MSENVDLDSLSDEDRAQVQELREAWADLANSLSVQPVLYNEKGEPIWIGERISGPDCKKRSDAILDAKKKEFDKIGDEAFADTLPLENALKPGECRFI